MTNTHQTTMWDLTGKALLQGISAPFALKGLEWIWGFDSLISAHSTLFQVAILQTAIATTIFSVMYNGSRWLVDYIDENINGYQPLLKEEGLVKQSIKATVQLCAVVLFLGFGGSAFVSTSTLASLFNWAYSWFYSLMGHYISNPLALVTYVLATNELSGAVAAKLAHYQTVTTP